MTVTDMNLISKRKQLSHRVLEREGEERIPKGFMKKIKKKHIGLERLKQLRCFPLIESYES